MQAFACPVLISLLLPTAVSAQALEGEVGAVRVALVKMPYTGARNVAEISETPEYLERGGIADTLREL